MARTGGNVPEALGTLCQVRTGTGGAITGLSGWKQPLTDAGLSRIVLIKSLKTLSLTGTSVTDDGIVLLESLPGLTELYLTGTQAHIKFTKL